MQPAIERSTGSGREYFTNLRNAGSLREERRALQFSAASTWAVGAFGAVVLVSPAGAAHRWSVLVSLSLIASTIVVGALWLRGPWPSARVAMFFCVYADVGIGSMLLLLSDPMIALVGSVWFGLVSEYISLTETGRMLRVHSLSVLALMLYLWWRATNQPGVDMRITTYILASIACVVIAAPLIRFLISNSMRATTMEAETLAQHDVLTGLLNRRGLKDAVQRLAARVRIEQPSPRAIADRNESGDRLVFAVLDLDHFKAVNDTYGHHHGDEVLRRVSRRLRESVGAQGSVARVGGEEFVVVLEGMTVDTDGLTQRLLDAVARDEGSFAITASLGAVVINRPEFDRAVGERQDSWDVAKGLIGQADSAMYEAKRDGGNQWRTQQVQTR